MRHPRSRLHLCCDCRAARTPRSFHDVANEGSSETFIKSEPELAAYLDHDELLCLICGTRHKGLYAHLQMAHNISARDYKIQHGIPITCGLIGKSTKQKMASNANTTTSKMRLSGFKNLEVARSHRGDTRTRRPKYMSDVLVEKMISSDNHPSKQTGVDVLFCAKCGSEVYVDAKISLSMLCRVLCDSCKT